VKVITSSQEETFDDEGQVQLEWFRIGATSHDPNHLISQLEGCPLEFHVSSRRCLKDETKIDMNQVSLLFVDQYVSVVPIFDLNDV